MAIPLLQWDNRRSVQPDPFVQFIDAARLQNSKVAPRHLDHSNRLTERRIPSVIARK
jgi:hypothetical protein